MVQPGTGEREAIHREGGRPLCLRRVGQGVGYVERKAIDTKAWCFRRERRVRFDLRHLGAHGRGTHGRIALLRISLLLRLPVLFRIGARGCGLVGRGRYLLCISYQWHKGGNRQ
ncbi:hypothetical protein BURPSPAST_A1094 [Burkholderia pseudomallei Pasteur 52237]|uniref:Uncharacterized protein n=1 Tax=Burkholderia pseudomallei (strain 1106a) TaxID=357348 RepID=A3NSU0_BURP0|nr:hypothetical protein BURPS1106A_1131 [Burkholderia pseudomallei 1106a]EDO94081.1 hypothetical protein BURPSPAST_A1094 [Burkholderia pseudomallei Pasteur 52237]